MRRKIILIGCMLLLLVGAGCEKKEPGQPVVVQPFIPPEEEFEEPKKEIHVYRAGGRRDPFMPLVEPQLGRIAPGGAMEEMEVVIKTPEEAEEVTGLERFELCGLVWDAKGEVGLLTGEDKSFTLVNGKLLDEAGNLLEDIKAERKKDEIILTRKGKSISLKIKEEERENKGEVR